MKRHETLSVSEIIRQAMEQAGSTNSYLQHQACSLWPEVVGPHINQQTTRRRVIGTEFHVWLASAPLKNELRFLTDQILGTLNKNIGQNVITKIIIH